MTDRVDSVAVVGGAGRVGLPLSLAMADRGLRVVVVDRDAPRLAALRVGALPFHEEGAAALLERLRGTMRFEEAPAAVRGADAVVLTIGTPVDEHHCPDLRPIFAAVDAIAPHLADTKVLVLRSTVAPGTSARVLGRLRALGSEVPLAYCPERIAQGRAIEELASLPQIVSGFDARAVALSRTLFARLAPELVEAAVGEAELAKLFCNAWRYVKFAAANELWQLATDAGLDFGRVRDVAMQGYARMADFPQAGFVAGPCLFKDAMQLAASVRHRLPVAHAAALVHETMPDAVVAELARRMPIAGATVGLLGMAYKPDCDDRRESLAYKTRHLLEAEGARVLCADPYVSDPRLVPLERLLAEAQALVIGCPHTAYRAIRWSKGPVVDCWGSGIGGS